MNTKLLLVMSWMLALCACAAAPSTPAGVPVNFTGCSSSVHDPDSPGGGDPALVLIVLGLETGYDIAAYSTCAVARLVHPGSAGAVTGDIYRSGRGTFSVVLPAMLPGMQKPSIDIIQPTVVPSESVLIRPMDGGEAMKSGLVAYGASIRQETALQQSSTLEQAGLEELQHQAGPTTATLVRHEPVTLDGRPALFAVYSVKLTGAEPAAQPHYLFMYFTRDQHDAAVLAIFWSGDCTMCTRGYEADIRALDPDIGRAVDSFHLDEKALLAWDSTQPKPAENAAPPALASTPVPAGKAVVYFYRQSQFAGGGLDFHIWENEKEIGNLTHGTYLHVAVDPGKHPFMMTTKHDDFSPCTVEIKSGEIHYFEVYVSRPAVYGQTLELTCRESAELETRVKMADLKDVTDDE